MVPTSDKLAELAQIYSQLKRIFEPGRVIPARDTPDTGELKRGGADRLPGEFQRGWILL